jgi:hypothetical protein
LSVAALLIAVVGAAFLWRTASERMWFVVTAKLWTALGMAANAGFLLGSVRGLEIAGLLAIGAWTVALPGLSFSIFGAAIAKWSEPRHKWSTIAAMLICLVGIGLGAFIFLQTAGGWVA